MLGDRPQHSHSCRSVLSNSLYAQLWDSIWSHTMLGEKPQHPRPTGLYSPTHCMHNSGIASDPHDAWRQASNFSPSTSLPSNSLYARCLETSLSTLTPRAFTPQHDACLYTNQLIVCTTSGGFFAQGFLESYSERSCQSSCAVSVPRA